MTPEMKKRLDAAEARLAAIRAKAGIAPDAKSVTVGVTSPETAADVARRIEVLERTVKSYESENRERVAPAATTKAFTAKASESAELGIDGKKFSIVKALLARNDFKYRGIKAFEDHRAEYERDALSAYYSAVQAETGKTMQFGDEPSGGFLVPPEVRAPIDALRSATWLDQLPVTKFTGLTYSPVVMPRVTSDNTSYWVAEGTATTASDPATDQITLAPKILANGTKLSLHLMRKAPGVAEQVARRSIAASMQRKLELGLIEGASGGPLGLSNFTNIGSVSFSGTDGDTKQVKVNQMLLELTHDNVSTAGGMFLMSEKVWANLVGVLHIGAGSTVTNRAASKKFTDFAWVDPSGQKWLAGFKVVTTNNLTVSTTGELFFGRWEEMYYGDWGAAEMRMTEEGQTLALARQALITTFQEANATLAHPEAFCKGTAFTVALS